MKTKKKPAPRPAPVPLSPRQVALKKLYRFLTVVAILATVGGAAIAATVYRDALGRGIARPFEPLDRFAHGIARARIAAGASGLERREARADLVAEQPEPERRIDLHVDRRAFERRGQLRCGVR